MVRVLTCVCCLPALAFLSAACAREAPVEVDRATGERLIKQRCSECHDPARIKESDFDYFGWLDVIDRMRDNGAEVSERDGKLIASYLATR